MTNEEKRIEKLETTLRVIHTWADYYKENYGVFQPCEHILNYKHIVNACKKVLKVEKK